jgi:hypothetical protein
MKTKNRPKSKNIEDRRGYGKTQNGKGIERIILKDISPTLKLPKMSKYKHKNLAANSSSKKRMSKAR